MRCCLGTVLASTSLPPRVVPSCASLVKSRSICRDSFLPTLVRRCLMGTSLSGGRRRGGHPVPKAVNAVFFGTVGAAEDDAVLFDAVSDDLAVAMLAVWSEHMDGTLERVEDVHLPRHRDREGLVVFIAAVFARGHGFSPQ